MASPRKRIRRSGREPHGASVRRLAVNIGLAGAFAVALALVGSAVRRPLVMMRQVGLAGWRPESGRRCENLVGSSLRHCYGPVAVAGDVHAEEHVTIDRRSGQVTDLERVWRVSDSTEMRRQEDSVARALVGHGGAPISCPQPRSTEGGAQRIAAWRFQQQDVRMLGSRWRGPTAKAPTWVIQISGLPVGYSGCQAWIHTRRLLTPMELLGGLTQWFVDRVE